MPVYLFSVKLKGRFGRPERVLNWYREYDYFDIDRIWQRGEIKCREKGREELLGYECVSVSRKSSRYQKYLAAEAKRKASAGGIKIPALPVLQGNNNRTPRA